MNQNHLDTIRSAANTCSSISMTLTDEPHKLTNKDLHLVREELLRLRRELRDVQVSIP